ncbi:MAG: hypothetical protein QM727_10810 [Niabella sp.]
MSAMFFFRTTICILAVCLCLASCNNGGNNDASGDALPVEPDPVTYDTLRQRTDTSGLATFTDSIDLSDFRKDYKVDSQALRLKQRLMEDTSRRGDIDETTISEMKRASDVMKQKGAKMPKRDD